MGDEDAFDIAEVLEEVDVDVDIEDIVEDFDSYDDLEDAFNEFREARNAFYEQVGKHEGYPYEHEEQTLNGTDVTLMGVTHNEPNFHLYRHFLREQVEEADAIMLEQSAERKFWEDEGFFGRVGELAYDAETPVYVADPHNAASNLIDVGATWYAALGTLTSSLAALTGAIDGEIQQALHEAGQTGLYTYIFFSTTVGTAVRMKMGGNEELTGHWFDKISYGEFDYRNIEIASGIDDICASNDIDSLTAIHGHGHTGAIKGYLESPLARKVKGATYFPFKAITDNSVRKYLPDSEGWQPDDQ